MSPSPSLPLLRLSPLSPLPLLLQTWVEVARHVSHWPEDINTATFVISACSLVLMALLGVANQRLVPRLKVCCCGYSKEKACHTTGRVKWPLPIPVPLVLVRCSCGRALNKACKAWSLHVHAHTQQKAYRSRPRGYAFSGHSLGSL